MPFNGPTLELPSTGDGALTILQGQPAVYCTQCGTIFVYAQGRNCPSCTLANRLEEVEQLLDALGEDDETIAEHIVDSHTKIDERLEDLEERLDRAERDIDIIDGGV